jgi:hypothetical protein
MAIKEDAFEVKLFVGDKQVAESRDVNLWQAVLAAISRSGDGSNIQKGDSDILQNNHISDAMQRFADESLANFAKTVGVDKAKLQGACDPQKEEPFMHLDMHHWAEWAKNVPERGRSAIGSSTLAATLLCLWFRSSGQENPTLRQSQKILFDIGIKGNNPTRSIRNCSWLQLRNGQILQLNPAAIEQAIEIARAFCEKRPPKIYTAKKL